MLNTIKFKFIIIYILNVSDIFFTMLLLKTGAFIEANFFMKGIVKSTTLSFVIKLGIPLLLLFIIYIRIKAATERQLSVGNILVNGCLLFYSLINFSHIVWIFLYNIFFS